jgi:N-acetyl-gamma-glutamyl-phosphate reductase
MKNMKPMSKKVFVDGEAGTTGLKLRERLALQPAIELLHIDLALRKDTNERARLLNEADIVFLCLPDVASIEAVSLVKNEKTRIIDASTAFRCDDSWAYGFPELEPSQRERIRRSKRVAVPGCYATGFTAAVHPLVTSGVIGGDYPLAVSAVSGYTGGGKKLIEKYENRGAEHKNDIAMKSPRFYALDQNHKHLPEMVKINHLAFTPVFTPIVGDYSVGMLVSLPLNRRLFKKKLTLPELHEFFTHYYDGEQFIKVMPLGGEGCLDGGFLDATGCNGTNRLELYLFGHNDQILAVSRLDNLGKGASGAAVQCMNIMLGQNEATGLL